MIPSDTIADIKEKIQDKKKIPRNTFKLYFNDRFLCSGNTLADYNIQKESLLYMKNYYFIEPIFKIVFKGVEYKTPGLDGDYTFGWGLKLFMSKQTNIDYKNIVLVKDYVAIEEGVTLFQQDITPSTKIYMIIKDLHQINVFCDEKEYEVYCEKPLKLSEIKELIKKKIKDLKEFEIKYDGCLINGEDELNKYPYVKELKVVRKQ